MLKQLESQKQLDPLHDLFPGLEIVAFDDLLGDPKKDNESKFVEGTNILRFDFGFAKPKEKRTISGVKRKKAEEEEEESNNRSLHLIWNIYDNTVAEGTSTLASEGLFRHAMYLCQ